MPSARSAAPYQVHLGSRLVYCRCSLTGSPIITSTGGETSYNNSQEESQDVWERCRQGEKKTIRAVGDRGALTNRINYTMLDPPIVISMETTTGQWQCPAFCPGESEETDRLITTHGSDKLPTPEVTVAAADMFSQRVYLPEQLSKFVARGQATYPGQGSPVFVTVLGSKGTDGTTCGGLEGANGGSAGVNARALAGAVCAGMWNAASGGYSAEQQLFRRPGKFVEYNGGHLSARGKERTKRASGVLTV
ncbi:hypothetical protein Bbelb_230800 [Branchiostoma belcheri]|nr:hypothetical protein Bbelb_230800 [Branchiostoma belcheri]